MNSALVFHKLGNLAIDISTPCQPQVTPTNIEINFNGTFFNKSIGEHTPMFPQNIPLNDTGNDVIQFVVSEYTVDSLFMTLFESNDLKFHLSPDTFPSKIPYEITTTFLEDFFPGLISRYGKDTILTVDLLATKMPQANFDVGEISATFSMQLRINAPNETAIVLNIDNSKGTVSISFMNFTLAVTIDKISAGTISVVSSTIGKINTRSLSRFVNVILRVVTPIANHFLEKGTNHFLEKGIKIPDSFAHGTLSINEAEFNSGYQYLQILAKPVFTF